MDRIDSLILRRESYGGILFNPNDATFVEVDDEGFSCLRSFAENRDRSWSEKESLFLKQIGREVDLKRAIRLFDNDSVGVNADRSSYPALKVRPFPTLIDFMITRKCDQGCPHCYANATMAGAHVKTQHIFNLIDEAAQHGTLELAIGGGEPTMHPDFCEILRYSHMKGVVPSVTTGGGSLTVDVLKAMSRYVGAVGLSLEGVGADFSRRRKIGFTKFQDAIELMKSYQIPVVLQITLSSENYRQLDTLVDFCLSVPGLYGVLFLAFKSTGRGRGYNRPLSQGAGDVAQGLARAFQRLSPHTRVGYDVCMTAAMTRVEEILFQSPSNYLEGCTAMRSSVGITPELDVLPCTFWSHLKMGNLKTQTLHEIWYGQKALSFRDGHQNLAESKGICVSCQHRSGCLGGCPVTPLVDCTKSLQQAAKPAE